MLSVQQFVWEHLASCLTSRGISSQHEAANKYNNFKRDNVNHSTAFPPLHLRSSVILLKKAHILVKLTQDHYFIEKFQYFTIRFFISSVNQIHSNQITDQAASTDPVPTPPFRVSLQL